MSKNTYKRHNNNAPFKSDNKSFGTNGILYNDDKHITIINKDNFSYCWLLIADDFAKYLVIRGNCRFQIFCGTLKVNGVEFSQPFDHRFYSPISHALITLENGDNSKKNSQTIEKLVENLLENNPQISFDENEKEFLKSIFELKNEIGVDKKWIIARLEAVNCVVSEDIAQFRDFRRLFEVNTSFPFARKLKFSVTVEEHGSFIMTKEISDCIDIVMEIAKEKDDSLSLALVGPKDAGKSSLMRTVINRFFSEGVEQLFVLDGDPGQSEFSPSGCLTLTRVSAPLFGPPFTHQYSRHVTVLKQFYIGLLSPYDNPKLYCRTFELLYHSFQAISAAGNSRQPLLINTMGWPQGLGLSLLAFKLLLCNPTFVLQLKKGRSEKEIIDLNVESIEKLCENNALLRNVPRTFSSIVKTVNSAVPSGVRCDLKLTPLQHRDLTMLSYLFQQTMNVPLCFPANCLPEDYNSNPVTRLRCRIPAFLRYYSGNSCNNTVDNNNSLPLVHLKLVHSEIDSETQSKIIAQCFSMQWVAICRPFNKPKYVSVIANNAYSSDNNMKESEPMYCIGMGIVSHIREENCEIDLLTGVDRKLLDGSVLVKGKVFSPDCLFLNQREVLSKNSGTSLPFLSPMITVGIGRTSVSTRKSLPKIRRHKH